MSSDFLLSQLAMGLFSNLGISLNAAEPSEKRLFEQRRWA
jgi:hypothetical protein